MSSKKHTSYHALPWDIGANTHPMGYHVVEVGTKKATVRRLPSVKL